MFWIKAFHIIFMVAWFAGLFYLPRLFAYHADRPEGAVHELFCVMERRLYRVIMMPAMVLTLTFGAALAARGWIYLSATGWFWVKLACVAALVVFHFMCGAFVRRFAEGRNTRSSAFFRVLNEVPTVILFAVVILVVVRPF